LSEVDCGVFTPAPSIRDDGNEEDAMKNYSFFPFFFGLVAACMIFGCNSGSSGGDVLAGEDTQSSISTKSAYPGDYIVATHNSIKEGQESTVEFTGEGGYYISFKTEDTADGIVRFPVPFYLDTSTGQNAAGTVIVRVNGNTVADEFTIRAIPDLGIDPGKVYVEILEKTVENYSEAQDYLWDTYFEEGLEDLLDSIDELDTRISQCLAMIDEIETTGKLTLSVNDGDDPVTLTGSDLAMLDQWLAVWILGMDAALTGSSPMSAGGIDMEGWSDISAKERAQRIQDGIDHVISEFKRGLEGGKVLIGAVTLLCTVGGFLVAGPAGALIGAAAGLALGYVSAGFELGSSAVYNRICESFSQKFRPAYDWGKNVLGQAVRVALSAAGGLKDKIGTIFTIISSAVTLNDSVDSAKKTRCGEDDQSKGIYSHVSFPVKSDAYTIDEFCSYDEVSTPDDTETTITDDSESEEVVSDEDISDIETTIADDIIADVLSAQISIPDENYSLNFLPEYVQAGFGQFDDGATLDMIPSIIGSDCSFNDFDYYSTTLTIMIHPNLNLSGDSPWILSVDPYIELFEGDEVDIMFFTEQILNDTPINDPVIFSAVGGTVTLEAYGTQDGELLKGTFSVTLEGDKDYWDYLSEDIDHTETLTGTISGSFDGMITGYLSSLCN